MQPVAGHRREGINKEEVDVKQVFKEKVSAKRAEMGRSAASAA